MIYTRYRTFFFLLCISLLTGCTSEQLNSSFFPGYRYDNANRVAKYYHDISKLPYDQQLQAYENARLAYTENGNVTNTLRYVLFLLLPSPELHNSAEAERILTALLQANQSENQSLEHISVLLAQLVREINNRKTLYEHRRNELAGEMRKKEKALLMYQKRNEKLSDIIRQKEQQAVYYQKLERALKEKDETIEMLQKKIEELKTIEKNLNQRRNTKSPTT